MSDFTIINIRKKCSVVSVKFPGIKRKHAKEKLKERLAIQVVVV